MLFLRLIYRLQSGLDFEGLATTMPGAAPIAPRPSGPILFRTPWRAMGLSFTTKSSTVDGSSRSRGVGVANIDTANNTSTIVISDLRDIVAPPARQRAGA